MAVMKENFSFRHLQAILEVLNNRYGAWFSLAVLEMDTDHVFADSLDVDWVP